MSRKLIALIIILGLLTLGTPSSSANQEQRIQRLENRISVLEKELDRLKKQEERASKYLKSVQKVEGNDLVVPFRILNCIRK